jgi:hypothetical protein
VADFLSSGSLPKSKEDISTIATHVKADLSTLDTWLGLVKK